MTFPPRIVQRNTCYKSVRPSKPLSARDLIRPVPQALWRSNERNGRCFATKVCSYCFCSVVCFLSLLCFFFFLLLLLLLLTSLLLLLLANLLLLLLQHLLAQNPHIPSLFHPYSITIPSLIYP